MNILTFIPFSPPPSTGECPIKTFSELNSSTAYIVNIVRQYIRSHHFPPFPDISCCFLPFSVASLDFPLFLTISCCFPLFTTVYSHFRLFSCRFLLFPTTFHHFPLFPATFRHFLYHQKLEKKDGFNHNHKIICTKVLTTSTCILIPNIFLLFIAISSNFLLFPVIFCRIPPLPAISCPLIMAVKSRNWWKLAASNLGRPLYKNIYIWHRAGGIDV